MNWTDPTKRSNHPTQMAEHELQRWHFHFFQLELNHGWTRSWNASANRCFCEYNYGRHTLLYQGHRLNERQLTWPVASLTLKFQKDTNHYCRHFSCQCGWMRKREREKRSPSSSMFQAGCSICDIDFNLSDLSELFWSGSLFIIKKLLLQSFSLDSIDWAFGFDFFSEACTCVFCQRGWQ